MQTKITGRVWKYGDDVNTDVIFPGKYTYSISDPQEMAQHALEDLDPTFVATAEVLEHLGDGGAGGRHFVLTAGQLLYHHNIY